MLTEKQIRHFLDMMDDYGCQDFHWTLQKPVMKGVLELALKGLSAQPEGVAPPHGWWSFLRSVLSQGASIQQDYIAGTHKGYEEYSARLDAAARERAEEISAVLAPHSPQPTTFDKQIADAKAEVETWSEERKKNCQLQGRE